LAEFSKYPKYQPFKFYLLISVIACFPVTYAHRKAHVRHDNNPKPGNPDRGCFKTVRTHEYSNDTNIRSRVERNC